MRYAILLVSVLIFQACGTVQKSKNETMKNPTDFTVDRVLTGTIHVSDACGVSIEVQNGENPFELMVENLDATFQVEGKRILFRFSSSSLPIVQGCNAIARGVVHEVTALN